MGEKPKTIDDKTDLVTEALDAMFDMLTDMESDGPRVAEYDDKRLAGILIDTLKTLKQETRNDENQNL